MMKAIGQRPPVGDGSASVSEHWDRAYDAGGASTVSWYEPTARVSLEIVSALRLPLDAPVIDVGGGASTLAGELVAQGFSDVSVLDVSEVALRDARERAGGAGVRWLHEDVLRWLPEHKYGLWHDRAVLHFFTEEHDRQAYLRALRGAVMPTGFVVLGVFAPDGPERCSGLPVKRYAVEDLTQFLGAGYVPRIEQYEAHVTPRGVRQPFTWVAFERVA